MLLKDITVYYIDITIFLILTALFIWFTFFILNFIFLNTKNILFKRYIFLLNNWTIL